ncbi:YolD-like family protein [Paenibacillus melissococcoides]|uniref:YolD-like family protein n=1 Tax=Paenibacillus melissococcoides TaxID=2912268 RepID=A0ABN8UCX7_9BACL|nr:MULTISPECIES: YolD-like family protein [Paenibacillus]MEB9892915.1 YolD-like family protein [Bacillus cereus]CAH8248553.1 YolD-like family protein [Paenibacillus melissococcoides]CAH8249042.1 YolD-like family protein [Paenibacillus melissococcoides]CAH8714410.1 YolD-like family protein [Paenibacillus melissococcoides]CAH8719808.1 YolD-like family protein [Paenibacillus melissococcoides]
MAKKTKPKRPSRDEFELEELGNQLTEAYDEKSTVSLAVWGREERVIGRVVEMDARTRLIHISRYGEITKVPFMDIMRVEHYSD